MPHSPTSSASQPQLAYLMQPPLHTEIFAAADLLAAGVDVSSGMPVLTPVAQEAVLRCPPAHEQWSRDLAKPSRGLQGSACRLVEIAHLAYRWPSLSAQQRRLFLAASGELAGTVLGELPEDPVEGWLEDDDFRTHTLLQLGDWGAADGARCQLVPATGPNAGTPCGRVVRSTDGQHIDGNCRAGERRVRIHNAARHALSRTLASFGLHSAEEVCVPAWAWLDQQGRWHDAILDVEARRPGSTVALRADLAFVNTQAAVHSRTTPSAALHAEAVRKYQRYGSAVLPLVAALRGRWSEDAILSLRLLAGSAAAASRRPASRILLSLVLAIAAGVASTEARSRIAILGGVAATKRLNNRVESLPAAVQASAPA